MAPTAGYLNKIKHATTLGGSYTAVAGLNDVSVSRNGEKYDISAYADNDGFRRFCAGLKTLEVTGSGSYLVGDTQQDAIRTAHMNGTTTFLQVLYDGTNGFKGEFLVDSFDVKPPMNDRVQFSFKASMTGAPTTVP